MMDEVRAGGGTIDVEKMSRELGIPVVPISAIKDEVVSELIDRAYEAAKGHILPVRADFCAPESPCHRCIHAVMHLVQDHAEEAGLPLRYCASKLIESDNDIADRLGLDENERELIEHCLVQLETESGLDRTAALADMRYTFIESVVEAAVVKCSESREHRRSVAIDRVLTGKYTAVPVFLGIILLIFWLTFNVIGAGLQRLLELGIGQLSDAVDRALTNFGLNEVVHSLIIDGIFNGVGSVLSFLPLIVTLFFFLSILEDTGYMARVAFVMDKPLRRLGLSGRSFVPTRRATLAAISSRCASVYGLPTRCSSRSTSALPRAMFSVRFSFLNHWRILFFASPVLTMFSQSRLGPLEAEEVSTSMMSPVCGSRSIGTIMPLTLAPTILLPTPE